MRRRGFLLSAGALLFEPLMTKPAESKKSYVLGVLSTGSATASVASPLRTKFLSELSKLGYTEGQNLVIEGRYSDGRLEPLPRMAAELVKAKVDLILVSSTGTAAAAKGATNTIPIVMVGVSDPLAAGLIASLARPGGNITGITVQTADITAKRLQFLKDAIPTIRRIGAVYLSETRDLPAVRIWLRENETSANVLGMSCEPFGLATQPESWDGAFALARDRRIEAVVINDGPHFLSNRQTLADAALTHRLPSIFSFSEQAQAGGMLSYGARLMDLMPRIAAYVDKILKGTNPADLPVEQPTTFDLTVNRKTANALGVKIPQSILLRADRVIE